MSPVRLAALRIVLAVLLSAAFGACHMLLPAPGAPANSAQEAALARSQALDQQAQQAEAAGDHETALQRADAAIAALRPAYGPDTREVTSALLRGAEIALDGSKDATRAEAYVARIVVPPDPEPSQHMVEVNLGAHPLLQGVAMQEGMMKSADARMHLRRAKLLSRLGKIVESDRAIALADRLMAEVPEALDPYGALRQPLLQEQAEIYAARGDDAKALVVLDGHPTNVLTLLKSSRLRYRRDDVRGALEDIELSSAGLETDMRRVYTGKHRDAASLASMVGMLGMQQAQALSLAQAKAEEPRARALALWVSALLQGRAFDSFAYERASWFGEREEKLARELGELRAQLAGKYLAGLDAHGHGTLDSELAERIHELEVAMREKGNFNPAPAGSYAEMRATVKMYVAAAPRADFPRGTLDRFVAALDAALQPNQALVSFALWAPLDLSDPSGLMPRSAGDLHYVALVVRKGAAAPELVDLGGADALDARVAPVLRALRGPESSLPQLEADAGALYEVLWKPLLPSLKGVEHALLVADGSLQLLSFAALYDPANARWLAESTHLSYLDSARDLLPSEHPTAHASERSLVLANPRPPAGHPFAALQPRLYPPLKGVAREAKAVAQILGANAFEGEIVNEASLRKVRRPRVLHIASHALFLPQTGEQEAAKDARGVRITSAPLALDVQPGQPASETKNPAQASISEADWMRAALVLGPPTAGEDGEPACCDSFATAYELAALDLHGTELVTLSACETAIGETIRQHGVTSLRRALRMAGAASVVASLWQVADDSTVVLMERFYRELQAGASRIAALDRAMVSVRNQRPHPFYWAPFTLSGSTGALSPAGPPRAAR